MAERLQKVLAKAGLGSRRKCEQFIIDGRVTVDGEVAELGMSVDPQSAEIRVDGVRIAQTQGHVVVALHKPIGVVTTMHDPQGRPCVGDYVANEPERLFHIGRLDADTSGLLLLTNDGELAQRLGHPSHEVHKKYIARVTGRVSADFAQRLKSGVFVDGRIVAVSSAIVRDQTQQSSVVELQIHEGRNRIVRRLFDQLGHPVIELVRTEIGPIRLGQMRPGQLRNLTHEELGQLYNAVGL